MSASKDADCQRGSEARVCRRQSLAERGAEARTSAARTRAEGTLADRPRVGGGGGQGAALAVGVRPQRGRTRHDDPTNGGLAIQSVFRLASSARREENQSVGHGLHEEGHISWLDSRTRRPKNREQPRASKTAVRLGACVGVLSLFLN